MCSIASLVRLCFIVTFYLYEIENRPELINLVHFDMVVLYVIAWLTELIHDLIIFPLEVKDAFLMMIRPDRKGKKNTKSKKGK